MIGSALQPNTPNHGGLTRVDIPSGSTLPFPDGPDPKTWEGEWSSITDPELIATHVCAANARQYNMASHTPFATEPLASYFGAQADAPGTDSLLQGDLPPESILSLLQPETIAMLETMVQPKTFPACENTH